MKTKKVSKFLILLACCALVLAFGSVSVSAAETVTDVDVKGLTLPAIGQHPDFSVSVPDDADYTLGLYAEMGTIASVFWYETEYDEVVGLLTKDDVFEKGGEYRMEVCLQAKDGYIFDADDIIAMLDNSVELYVSEKATPTEQQIILTYDFYVGNINEVFVTDLALPVAGQHPDYEVSVPTDADYHLETITGDGWINHMLWIDVATDEVLGTDDAFIAGHSYRVLIDLMPNDDALSFSDPVLGFVNGERASVYYPWGIRLEMVYVAASGEEPGHTNPFTDVVESDYFYEPVLWAVEEGITNGMDESHFGPADACTRAHAVTFLWRAAGCPEPIETANPFTDVKPTDYYYKAVMWALEEGITNGMDINTFGPDVVCERMHIVTFLWRAENQPEPESQDHPFIDVEEDSYYEEAVIWAVEEGITNGMDESHFGPAADCERAHIVTFLHRAFIG